MNDHPDLILVHVNGEELDIARGLTVAALLETLGVELELGGIAVARNDAVVSKSTWEDTILVAGDQVEVIRATAGG